MAYYNVCPNCGSNLDPNEKCDCESTQEREKEQSMAYYRKYLRMDGRGGQMAFAFDGQKALVMLVVMNRVLDDEFPDRVII